MTESISRFSLFLIPCENDYGHLAAVIQGVAAVCDASPFEPHVTVYSGPLQDVDNLRRAVTAALEGMAPFSLKVGSIVCGEEYFKSLFVEFEESAILRTIHERLKVELDEDSGYRLMPHLSLLYSDTSPGKKEELARGVVLERGEVLFDRVKVVSPGNRREGWRDTGGWRTLFTLKLGGECRCGQ